MGGNVCDASYKGYQINVLVNALSLIYCNQKGKHCEKFQHINKKNYANQNAIIQHNLHRPPLLHVNCTHLMNKHLLSHSSII